MKPVANQLRVPGIALVVLGALGIVYGIGGAFYWKKLAAEAEGSAMGHYYFIGFSIVLSVIALLTLIGGVSILQLKRYPLAMTGAIAASIPFLSPCLMLALPFGIWAAILLSRPEAKAAFAQKDHHPA